MYLKNTQDSRKALLILVISIYVLTTFPRLLDADMFFDGVHFASVARNLAEGVGTFWEPHLASTVRENVENTHPPLGFGILAVLYNIFGDSTYVENFYGFALGLVIIFLLARLWRKISSDLGAWLVTLLFVSIPMTSHHMANNFLEIPMTALLLASAVCWLNSLSLDCCLKASAFWAVLAGVLIFCAVLTKGPAALFVFSVPFFVWLFRGVNFKRFFGTLILGILSFALLSFLIIYLNDVALKNTKILYSEMIFGSLKGVGGTGSRWRLFSRLYEELLLPFLICLIICVITYFKTRKDKEAFRLEIKKALPYILLALAGTLPFLVTTKQYRRYIFPALPFFVIGFALVSARAGVFVEQRFKSKGIKYIYGLVVVLLVGVVTLSYARFGVISRNHGFHNDFTKQPMKQFPERKVVTVCPAKLARDWSLFMDFQRYYKVSLTGRRGTEYLLVKNGIGCDVPNNCQQVHPPQSHEFTLYKCILEN